MPTLSNTFIETMALSHDGSGGTNTQFDPVLSYGTSTSHVPTWDWLSDGSITDTSLSPVRAGGIASGTASVDLVSWAPATVDGSNEGWTFDVQDLRVVSWTDSSGGNTTSGDISNLPSSMTYYSNTGSNTTSGDIANLPASMALYVNTGSNTTSGDIANLPASLTHYNNQGVNTTSGDIANLPSSMTYYSNRGVNTVTYAGGAIPCLNTCSYWRFGGVSRLSTVVDAIINAISATTVNNGTLDLSGNQPRTAASDAAVTTLTNKGWVVTTA